MNEEKDKIVYMIIVAKRKQKDELLTIISDSGIHVVNVMYGKGSARMGYLMNILGFVVEENKVIIMCVTTYAKSELVYEALIEEFHFNEPNTGIAFTIPIDNISF